MTDSFEVYVLCANRSYALGARFLDAIAPSRESLADEFPFPELAECPIVVMNTPCDAMKRLEREPQESYALYWSCDDHELYSHAMLVFTQDGGMIAGLAARNGDPADALSTIAGIVSGRYGYVTTEGRPLETAGEFIELCRRSTIAALVDGVICNKSTKIS